MNAQILFIVCFSASLAGVGIALVCVGLMLILKSERRRSTTVEQSGQGRQSDEFYNRRPRETFYECRAHALASKSNTTDSVQHLQEPNNDQTLHAD